MSCTIYDGMFHVVIHYYTIITTIFTFGQIGHVYSPLHSHNALGCQLFLSFTLCPLSDVPLLTAETSAGMGGGRFLQES